MIDFKLIEQWTTLARQTVLLLKFRLPVSNELVNLVSNTSINLQYTPYASLK